MMVFRSVKMMSAGKMMVGCLHGFSRRSFWKYVEQADKTTWKKITKWVYYEKMKYFIDTHLVRLEGSVFAG